MTAIRALLRDRKRSQRGSVLSGVLLIVAFLAIISGALMTELSTNFLLSRNLVNRVSNEATVNSAIELSLSQLQAAQPTQLNAPCPALSSVTLNGRAAKAAYVSCWPAVYEARKFWPLASASRPFSIEGTHTPVGSLNDYVIGNPDGMVFDYTYGQSSLRWKRSMGGAVTGPPLVMAGPSSGSQYVVIPYSCSPSSYCVNVLFDNGSSINPITQMCSIPTNAGAVVTQPAASLSFAGTVFYAAGAALEATNVPGGAGNNCDLDSNSTVVTEQPIVAGPMAFRCSSCGSPDQVYAIISAGSSSELLRFTYNGGLSLVETLNLPSLSGASGMDASGTTLPATLAITFQGGNGGIALVNLPTSGPMKLINSASNLGKITGSPSWCVKCGNLIGVGTPKGLYVFDSTLTQYAYPSPGSAPISTTPQADDAGNWYFGADDGYVYEAQLQKGQPVMIRTGYGSLSQVGSSVQVGSCQNPNPPRNTWICVYLGSLNGTSYLIPLDSRDAVITACIGSTPCLWTHVDVGIANDSQSVHVQGWSYYSP